MDLVNLAEHERLETFGFTFKRSSPHTARTIMLAELTTLLARVGSLDASKTELADAIVSANCLGKRSVSARNETFKRLTQLYALDPKVPLFRVLRWLWARDPAGQPLLAALTAYCRDPLFRSAAAFVLALPQGAACSTADVEDFVATQEPGRFTKVTLASIGRNLRSSFTQTGHLSGQGSKVRARAVATPGAVALALLLGWLAGGRGPLLFSTDFMALLDCGPDRALELGHVASASGWISLKSVGQVIEVAFPSLFTPEGGVVLREQG